MPRYRLTLEYDGRAYHGFQAQDGLPTVQGAVETAITGFSGQTVRIAAAGRTDTGVHATGHPSGPRQGLADSHGDECPQRLAGA